MTCIIGLVDENKNIYMGGDSAAVKGYTIVTRKDPKVFKKDNVIIGFCGSWRMGQLLRWSFKPPIKTESIDIEEYMNTSFINSIRKCLSSGGFLTKKDGEERGGVFLVGIEGRLFRIDSDFHVGENLSNYDAIGCGEEFALGAMYVLESDIYKKPEGKIFDALVTVQNFCSGVREPFIIDVLRSVDKIKTK